ncbi:MAG: fibronectin type III domain-containing protein [Candidatus Krumholzibacteria bacterium]|nr:fibronectin type III domain-containing protein [Candidatus Krumholzibacteria bacterium]
MRSYTAPRSRRPERHRNTALALSVLTLLVTALVVGCNSDSPTDPGVPVPPPPTGVTATAADGSITISWKTLSDVTGYTIYWDTVGHVDSGDSSFDAAAPPFLHNGLTNGTTYYYRVGSQSKTGPGALSGQVSATPSGAIGVRTIACGKSSSFLVDGNGNVHAWGANDDGQLGIGSFSRALTPTVVTGITDVVAISSNGHHTLALTGSGKLYAWGYNTDGELGNGGNQPAWSPTQVSGPTDFAAIAAGKHYSVGVTSDGRVWAWGSNVGGHLGLGYEGGVVLVPTLVMTSVLNTPGMIAAGDATSFFKPDDTATNGVAVYSWGSNIGGVLGRDDGNDSTIGNTPGIIAGTVNVTAISIRYIHVLALRRGGSVLAWGGNSDGELGDGTTVNGDTPNPVNLVQDVQAVAAGTMHSLALGTDGRIMAWGGNSFGQLGDGTYNSSPVRLWVNNLTNITMIAAGESHSLALRDDGTLWSWGNNTYGQLGDGGVAGQLEPVRVSGY